MIDVTSQVSFVHPKDVRVVVYRCVCGCRETFTITQNDLAPEKCPRCGRLLYFKVAVKIYEKAEPLNKYIVFKWMENGRRVYACYPVDNLKRGLFDFSAGREILQEMKDSQGTDVYVAEMTDEQACAVNDGDAEPPLPRM
jgi:hypothetical protein